MPLIHKSPIEIDLSKYNGDVTFEHSKDEIPPEFG
jgi:hypothetical protein